MSIELMSKVWKRDLEHNEKYVLLSLADHANDDGENVFPSVGYIAWKTDYCERTIQQILRSLEEKGCLVPAEDTDTGGRGKTRVYKINIGVIPEKPKYQKGANSAGFTSSEKGAVSSLKGAEFSKKGAKSAPESLVNHKEKQKSVEPSNSSLVGKSGEPEIHPEMGTVEWLKKSWADARMGKWPKCELSSVTRMEGEIGVEALRQAWLSYLEKGDRFNGGDGYDGLHPYDFHKLLVSRFGHAKRNGKKQSSSEETSKFLAKKFAEQQAYEARVQATET